jgi:hypothetical protein
VVFYYQKWRDDENNLETYFNNYICFSGIDRVRRFSSGGVVQKTACLLHLSDSGEYVNERKQL